MHLTQVHANGKNVVYQIISPISNYFTIETGKGSQGAQHEGMKYLWQSAPSDHVGSFALKGLTDLSLSCLHTDTGLIRNTYNLDLKRNPELANTLLVVKAYNLLHPADNANITVNITVQRQNLQGPECIPAIVV